jgi:hypothetical protein
MMLRSPSAKRNSLFLLNAVALAAATSACSAASSRQAHAPVAAEQAHYQQLLRMGFTRASGNIVYRTRGLYQVSIYDAGICVPIFHGWIGTAKLPYHGNFGPNPHRAANILTSATMDPYQWSQLLAGRDLFPYMLGPQCPKTSASASMPVLNIYFERDRDSLERRAGVLAAERPAISSIAEGNKVQCPVFAFATRGQIHRTDVVVPLARGQDLATRALMSCIIRATFVSMGLPGAAAASDEEIIHPDHIFMIDPQGVSVGQYAALGLTEFASIRLPPGQARESAEPVVRSYVLNKVKVRG